VSESLTLFVPAPALTLTYHKIVKNSLIVVRSCGHAVMQFLANFISY